MKLRANAGSFYLFKEGFFKTSIRREEFTVNGLVCGNLQGVKINRTFYERKYFSVKKLKRRKASFKQKKRSNAQSYDIFIEHFYEKSVLCADYYPLSTIYIESRKKTISHMERYGGEGVSFFLQT